MRHSIHALVAMAALIAGIPGASAAERPVPMSGAWDLIWQTRKGPSPKGGLQIDQKGSQIVGEIHGQGRVRARGSVTGSSFVLRGSRLAVPYFITGTVSGNRMEGSLQVLSVRRQFTGVRRK